MHTRCLKQIIIVGFELKSAYTLKTLELVSAQICKIQFLWFPNLETNESIFMISLQNPFT